MDNFFEQLNTPSQPATQPTQSTPQIDAGQIGNVSPVQTPQPQDSVASILAELQSLSSAVPDDSTQSGLENALIQATMGLEGQAQFTAQQENELGIPQLQQQIADVSGQALKRYSLLQSQIQGLEGQGSFAATTRGRESRAVRQASIEIQGLQAQQAILQGQLSVAQSKVDRAVSLKFDPIKERISTLNAVIGVNKDKMTRQQLSLAEKRQSELFVMESRLKVAESLQQTSLNELISASKLGMPSGRVNELTQGVLSGRITPQQAITEAAQYTGKIDRINMFIKQSEYDNMMKALNGNPTIDAETREKIGKYAPAQQANLQINLVSNLSRLADLVREYGTTNPLDANARGAIEALRSQLEIDIAVAGGQGAISGQEADRYRKIIGSSWKNGQRVLSGIEEAITVQDGKIKSNINLTEATYPGAINFEPFKEYFGNKDLNNYLDEIMSAEQPQNKVSNYLQFILGIPTQ